MGKMSELSQVLDELIACGEGLIRTANAIRGIFADEQTPAQALEPHKPETAAVQTDTPKHYTFAEVRKAFSAKSHAGHTEQIKALLASYGADRLSAVKEEDYPRLMQDLEAIA